MRTYVTTITPEKAAELLKLNTMNRPVKKNWVSKIAEIMRQGAWKLNGESIKFNSRVLLDGQHRLMACVLAAVPFVTLVAEGVDEDTFSTIDAGIPRSGMDTLSLKKEKNAAKLAAALRLVDRYMTGRMSSWICYSNSEMLGLLEKYPDIRESVNRAETNRRLIAPSIVAAAHYLFSRKDPTLADLFIDQVLKGEGLKEGEPAYVFRERMVRNSLNNAKLGPDHVFALFIKSWNLMRSGKQCRRVVFMEGDSKAEEFPLVQ
jgi:hypothetical protein